MGKIVITGTGRCGTSFLMHLFTALGFNTGYNLDECEQHLKRSGCDGGIEHSIGTELFDKSDIVKNPEWMYKPELLDFDIDYLIVPIRKLEDVALSRARNINYGGFLKGATDVESQMKMDQRAFYDFIKYSAEKGLKVIFLDFPTITKDLDYLWVKLCENRLIDYGTYYHYKEVFNQISNPEKVHI